MNKINHSKYKNSGIIYELLIRQLTSDVVSSNKSSKALDIIKKYYNKTELAKEHKLYQILNTTKLINESKAEILINSVLESSRKLNRTLLRKEKYNIIKEIQEHYNLDNFFKAKVNNYKSLASIYVLIEQANIPEFTDPNQIINNKCYLLENICRKDVIDEEQDNTLKEYSKYDKGMRLLTYKLLIEKFNNKYSELSTPQKHVLKEYLNNISNINSLRDFLNNQNILLKRELKMLSKNIKDPVTSIKLNEVISLIKPIDKNQNVKDDNVLSTLQYHQLVNEIKSL
jgi:hypothetical protein